MNPTKTPFQIFICYAREDRAALESLLGHIAVFERSGLARIWYDREITGGKHWDDEIRVNLKAADVVLLLISPEFFRSDYIHSVELEEAIQRDQDKEALVVPVILKKCLWQKDSRISALQALPEAARPVFDRSHWSDPDDAFYDIANGLDRILEDPEMSRRLEIKLKKIAEIELEKKIKEVEKGFIEDEYYWYNNEMALAGNCSIQKGREYSTSSGEYCILLISGKNDEQIPLFAYTAVRTDKIESLIEAVKSGVFHTEDYGVTIEAGVREPSLEVRKKMEEDYGFDHANIENIL